MNAESINGNLHNIFNKYLYLLSVFPGAVYGNLYIAKAKGKPYGNTEI